MTVWTAWARQDAMRYRKRWGHHLALGLTLFGLACGGIADDAKLPPDVQDPSVLKTESGALARYRNAVSLLPHALGFYLMRTGILTDELADLPAPRGITGLYTAVDSRQDLSDFDDVYNTLHHLRGQAREARGFLSAYAPNSPPALAGHLFAVEAYAEILLADLFCSGIPLSTVDFNADFTLQPGSSTQDVYRHALTLFDSALAVSYGDSTRLQWFAMVGQARALVDLGRYAGAAAAVAGVPDDYQYAAQDPGSPVTGSTVFGPFAVFFGFEDGSGSYGTLPGTPSIGDAEGGNGLNYLSSGDPRILVKDEGPDVLGHAYYFPAQYPEVAPGTITVASGVEARLIEAEAALRASPDDGQWLAKLNQLRQTVGLSDTTDPGTAGARLDLLFRERAFWLYLTGHRQGDLRRLVREYLRSPDSVYPSGEYPGGAGVYGTEIVAPVPPKETQLNPKYTGCFHYGA